MTYSLEIRERALHAYNTESKTQEEIAELFCVSLSSFKRWLQKERAGEPLVGQNAGGRPAKIDQEGLMTLKKLVIENPSITLAELSKFYEKNHNVIVGRSVISRAMQQLRLRYKKLSVNSIEKDSEEVKKKRHLI